MNVAHVVPRYRPHVGGVETHVAQIATHLASLGVHVEVLTQEDNLHLPAVEILDGVTVRRFPVLRPSQHYAFAPALWTFLAHYGARYDILHAHNFHSVAALGAALTTHSPFVFTPHYHGTSSSPVRRLLHIMYRLPGSYTFRRAQRVICVSEAEAALVRDHFPFVSSRLSVIPNGVDVAALQAATPFREERIIVMTAGRLEGYKNVALIVRALTYLGQEYALRVIGDGPQRPALQELAAQLGLQERVVFLGKVDDSLLYRWFRTAAVYVSMSAHEAFGISLVQAIAAGAAVVASHIPAHHELAEASGPICLMPLNSAPRTLAAAIHAAATDCPTAQAPATLVSWAEVATRTLDIYRGVRLITDGGGAR